MRDRSIRTGVRRLFRIRPRSDAHARTDADDELAAFLDARIEDLVARGMSPGEARIEAARRLGGGTVGGAREQLRKSAERRERRMRLTEHVDELWQDIRYAVRQLVKAPAFAVVAVLTLALGVGANTAVFTVVDAVLLRTLPLDRPEELVAIGKATAINGHTTGSPRGDLLSLPMYRDLRRDDRLTRGLAATGTAGRLDVRIGVETELEHPNGRFVSGNYFDVLGVPAERGRVFGPTEDGAAGSSPVAVISDSYWRRRFGSDAVIGRTIAVDGAPLVIAGIARPGFTGEIPELPTDIWLPISMQPILRPHSAPIERRGTSWLLLMGRLAPGVTLEQARAGFTTLIRASLVANAASRAEAARYRRAPTSITSGAQGFSDARRTFRAALVTLQAGVVLLLAIVCANLANLLIARAAGRGSELSVRLALGAGRWRLVRQLMTESTIIAVLGAAVGLGLAWMASSALVLAAATSSSPIAPIALDGSVLAFTLGVTMLAVLCFGLVPALRASRADVALQMRAGSRSIIASSRHGRFPIGRMLVPMQVILSLVLLTGAALLARSLRNLESGDPGLDRDHLLVARVDVGARGIAGDRFVALAREITTRVASVPGVRSVTYSQNGLFTGSDGSALVAIPGFTGRAAQDSILNYDLVGPGYIGAIGGRMLRGRDLDPRDGPHAPSVAVVNAATERFYFGEASAVGKVIYFDANVPTTIVGVAGNVRDKSLAGPPERRAYVPYEQQIADTDQPELALEIRTAADPAAIERSVRAAIAAVDVDLPVDRLAPLSQLMADSIHEERLLSTIATAFGSAALVLAAIGLYGVMSYTVARRTGEIGLRAALGADRPAVMRLIVGDAMRLVALGVIGGLPLALFTARGLRSQLHDVSAADPVSFGLPLFVLLACAAIAALGPALRAARVAPSAALNQE